MNHKYLTTKEASGILDTSSDFHLGARGVYRFIGDPSVQGDNIAEHEAGALRLAVYSMPFILKEFAKHKDIKHLAEDIYATILTHDDEEVAQGFDIISPLKKHNVRDQEEIALVSGKMKKVPKVSREYVIKLFSSFRRRNTLASKIAKVFDNLDGNQVVLEQKLGLIAPHSVLFSFDYIERTKGASKTTDILINAQKKRIVEYREFVKGNDAELNFLAEQSLKQDGCKLKKEELKKIIKKLLAINLAEVELDKSKVTMKIWEYKKYLK